MNYERVVGGAILALWGGFWLYFSFASDIVGDGGWAAVARIAVVLGLFLGCSVVGWRWPRGGGALLIAIGIGLIAACVWYFNQMYTLFLLATLAAPPLLAGILLRRGS